MNRLLLLLMIVANTSGYSQESRSWFYNNNGSTNLFSINDASSGVSICFSPSFTAFAKIEANRIPQTGKPRVESKVTVYYREGSDFKPGATLPLPFFCVPQVAILSADARYLVCLNEHELKGGAIPPNCAVFIADFETKKSASFALNDFFPENFIVLNSDGSVKHLTPPIKETNYQLAGFRVCLRWFVSLYVEYDDFNIQTGGVYSDDIVGGKTYPFPKVKIIPKDMTVKIQDGSRVSPK